MSSKTRSIARGQQHSEQKQISMHKAEVRQEIYQGPLPKAEELEKYNLVCPGAADRIITMAENQSVHRQSIEKAVIAINSRNSFLGIICATIISLCILAGGVYCILEGHDTAGGIIVSIDLVSLCAVFIYGTNSNRKKE